MALCTVNWRSKVLNKWTTMNIILPECGKPPYPSFYLLHGLSDDYSIWLRQTRIEVYARIWPFLVIMPDGYRGFYTRNEEGPDYAKHIGEELVEYVDQHFQTKRSRSARCVGGLSMGGYGAMRIGLGYPDRFCSITAHSGALMHGGWKWTRPEQEFERRIFGRLPAGTDHDLVHLAKKAKRAGKLPKMRIDCGTEDFLLEANRQCHALLSKAGIAHEYEEFPGAHTWDYWDHHIQRAMAFHAGHMRLKQGPAW